MERRTTVMHPLGAFRVSHETLPVCGSRRNLRGGVLAPQLLDLLARFVGEVGGAAADAGDGRLDLVLVTVLERGDARFAVALLALDLLGAADVGDRRVRGELGRLRLDRALKL